MQDRAGSLRRAGSLPRTDGQGLKPHPRTSLPTQQTNANCTSRDFRTNYTNAYRVLYQDSTPPSHIDSLGYIPEIYDSAQEGFPFIYVNGEKYDFSTEVLLLGEKLVENYYKMVHELRVATLKREGWKETIRDSLEEFDSSWTQYEEVSIIPHRSTSAN